MPPSLQLNASRRNDIEDTLRQKLAIWLYSGCLYKHMNSIYGESEIQAAPLDLYDDTKRVSNTEEQTRILQYFMTMFVFGDRYQVGRQHHNFCRIMHLSPDEHVARIRQDTWSVVRRQTGEKIDFQHMIWNMKHSRFRLTTIVVNKTREDAAWRKLFTTSVKSVVMSLQEAFLNPRLYNLKNEAMLVWRGIPLPYEERYYRVNQQRGFVSVSKNYGTAFKFADHGCCVFALRVRQQTRFIDVNRHVPPQSRIDPEEEELIFPIGTVQRLQTTLHNQVVKGELYTPSIVALELDDVRFKDSSRWQHQLARRSAGESEPTI